MKCFLASLDAEPGSHPLKNHIIDKIISTTCEKKFSRIADTMYDKRCHFAFIEYFTSSGLACLLCSDINLKFRL